MTAPRNGSGSYVIRSCRDGRYIGREPDGNTPAIQCWPRVLNRHVMHFPTRAAAQEFIADGGTGSLPGSPFYEPHKAVRVRPIGGAL